MDHRIVQPTSDLHLEWLSQTWKDRLDELDPEGVDVLILAGDVDREQRIVSTLEYVLFRYAAVVWMAEFELSRVDPASCFIECCCPAEAVQSDTLSTGVDSPHPEGTKVVGGVEIAVDLEAAAGTPEDPLREGERTEHRVAVGTHLRGREEPIRHHKTCPEKGRLVGQLSSKLSPPHVGDGAGELPILQHSTDVQVLDHHRLVFAAETSCKLVKDIFADVSDPPMKTSDLPSGLHAVARPLHLPGVCTLQLSESLQLLPEGTGVLDDLPCGEGRQLAQSEIDADDSVSRAEVLRVSKLHAHREEPPSSLSRDRPLQHPPVEPERLGEPHPSDLREVDALAEQPHLLVVDVEAVVLPFLLEARVTGLLGEKSLERSVEIREGLEVRVRRALCQPGERDVLYACPLPLDVGDPRFRQQRILFVGVVPPLPLCEPPVPSETGTPDGPRKGSNLRRRGGKLDFVGQRRQCGGVRYA